MRPGAREGSPRVMATATSSAWLREDQTAPNEAAAASAAAIPPISRLRDFACMIESKRHARLPDPKRGHHQGRARIDDRPRDPHDNAGQLLIFQWRQSPLRGVDRLCAIEN